MMTEGLSHGPYIFASYAIGAILVFGFTLWQIYQRKKLRMLEQATREGGSPL